MELEGTTDLPDGSLLYLEVVHLDEWDRSVASPTEDRFGERGEDLRGPDVYTDEGFVSLAVEREFALP